MHNHRILTVLLLLFLGKAALGQQASCGLTISGHITTIDSVSSSSKGASVSIPRLRQTTAADSSGNFRIQNLCAGKIELKISFEGYQPLDTLISLTKDLFFDVVLSNSVQQLSSVTVSGELIHKDQITTAVKAVISGAALEEVRGLSLGESLKSISGVNSLQTGPNISKPVIHGVYSNRILIVNNGVRQEGQTWGNDHAPEIDPFIATKLTVIKGAASIRYGSDAIGGVVLVDPKDLPKEPASTAGEINLVGMSNGRIGAVSGMIEGAPGNKLEGLSWRLQGTLKKAGNASTADYYLGNTGYNEDDYSATLQYNKSRYGFQVYYSLFNTKIGIANASVVGSIADLYQAFARSQPADTAGFSYAIGRPYQTVNHQLVKATGFWKLPANGGKMEATYAYQTDVRKEFDADLSYNNTTANVNDIPDLNFRLNTQTVNVIWEHPAIAKRIVGSVGIDYITHGNYEQGTSYYQLIPNFIDYGAGIFAIEKYEIRKWLFEAGLRYDYRWLKAYALNPNYPTEEITPSYSWQNSTVNAGAEYKFDDLFSATYNFGTAWRPPQVIELFANGIHQSAASYEIGDSSLTLEKAYNNNLSFLYNGHSLVIETGFYVNYFHHYIYLRPDSLPVQTVNGAFPAYTYTQVNALFKGVDLSITYHFLNHFSLVSKTTIVRAQNRSTDQWLVGIPADRFDNSLRYHIDSVGKMHRLYLAVSNLAVLKQTRVPLKSDYVAPPPGYDLWGAEIGCSFPFFNKYVDLNFTVSNLTNVAYRDYLNRFRYFVNDLGRNFSLRLVVPIGGK